MRKNAADNYSGDDGVARVACSIGYPWIALYVFKNNNEKTHLSNFYELLDWRWCLQYVRKSTAKKKTSNTDLLEQAAFML